MKDFKASITKCSWRSLPVFIFSCYVFFGGGVSQAFASEISYLAFGDIRGNFEPCGCDPKTDLGGVRRLVAQIGRERALRKDFYLFSLGNNFPEQKFKLLPTQEKNKIPFLAETLKALKPDAALFNYSESEHVQNSSNYILTNQRGFLNYVVLKDAIVFGYTAPKDNFKAKSSRSAFFRKKVKEGVSKNPKLRKILLFSGPQSDLVYLKSEYGFDQIISSNLAPMLTPTGKKENENEKLLIRQVKDSAVWMTPHGGQGFLRGGLMQNEVAPTIAQIFSKESSQPKVKTTFVTWLVKELDDESVLKDMFSRYRDLSTGSFLKLAEERKEFLKNSKFVGADACKTCHAECYAVWNKSKHATAYSTLEAKNQHQNTECVGCHVVGYFEKGGFSDKVTSPHLANVQCENCHGPRLEHTKNPLIKNLANPREVCVGCHKPPHSSEFSFDRYWPKIKHGNR